jgi:hypothetical protein
MKKGFDAAFDELQLEAFFTIFGKFPKDDCICKSV